MPNDNDEPDDELKLFPNQIDRQAVDDTDEGTVPDVDEVEKGTDMEGADDPPKEQQAVDEEVAETISKAADDITHEGFITDGLTREETYALLGMTFMSYALAWGLLNLIIDQGVNRVPIYLWGVLAVLILLPLMLMFGSDIVRRLTEVLR